jgi:hypothetical protein
MEADKQDRAEELEALEAIFADDFKLLAEDTFELTLELPDGRRLAVSPGRARARGRRQRAG